jgi:hypothetical protein
VQKYQNNVQTQFGAPASYATISVVVHGSGGAATLYSTNGPSATPLSNPFTADVNGNFFFYALDGHYDVTISGANLTPYTVSDIILNDAAFGPDNTGPTSSRPTPPTLNQEYYDTTLGQPIWCTQVSPATWTNAAGVAV